MWHLLTAHQQESFLPFSSRQSLSCCLSYVAKRSTPKPRGPLYSPSEPRGPFPHFRTAWSSSFPLRTSWFSYSLQNRVAPYLLQNRVVFYLFTLEPRGLLSSEPRGSPIHFRAAWSLLPMAAGPRFKSQRPSSFAAPFPTPPTVSCTCQHPRILPAFLGCHSKSGQVWPHGVEPILSKLSRRPCNQGELLPRPTLGGSHSHLPGSKQGHSYLTYL